MNHQPFWARRHFLLFNFWPTNSADCGSTSVLALFANHLFFKLEYQAFYWNIFHVFSFKINIVPCKYFELFLLFLENSSLSFLIKFGMYYMPSKGKSKEDQWFCNHLSTLNAIVNGKFKAKIANSQIVFVVIPRIPTTHHYL